MFIIWKCSRLLCGLRAQNNPLCWPLHFAKCPCAWQASTAGPHTRTAGNYTKCTGAPQLICCAMPWQQGFIPCESKVEHEVQSVLPYTQLCSFLGYTWIGLGTWFFQKIIPFFKKHFFHCNSKLYILLHLHGPCSGVPCGHFPFIKLINSAMICSWP